MGIGEADHLSICDAAKLLLQDTFRFLLARSAPGAFQDVYSQNCPLISHLMIGSIGERNNFKQNTIPIVQLQRLRSGYDREEIGFQSRSTLSNDPACKELHRQNAYRSTANARMMSLHYFREIFQQTFAFRKQTVATAGISPTRGLSRAILPIDGIPERLRCARRPETSAHY